jgi:opacity protein-like surface antigen
LKHLTLAVAGLALVILSAVPVRAQDSARPRFYLHLRGQDTNPITEVHDHWGLSLGANLGRWWGAELSMDTFERHIDQHGNKIGEYGVVGLIPQARLRYPLLGDRLVPYVVGGIGVAFTEFNDRKPRIPPGDVRGASKTLPVATLGVGIEYYFADNLAVGVEAKHMFAEDQTFRINGERHSQEVASTFLTLGLRLLVPELAPAAAAPPPEPPGARLYVGIRFGGAISIDRHNFSSADIRSEPPAYFGTANQFVGGAFGVDFGRYLGVELAADGYEVVLADDRGGLAEVAVMHVIPQLRVRYPVLDGRLVPYALAGVGAGYVELNDRKQPGLGVDIDVSRWGVAGALGAGVEYFVASNIAFGLEARYLTNRGHDVRIGTREDSGHFDAMTVALTLRVILAQLGR